MRRLAVVAGAISLAMLASVGVSNSAPTPQTIRTVGRDTFIRNALIQSTYRFSPYRNVVQSGKTIRLKNPTAAPHTLTIVPAASRPSNSAEVFGCKVCGKYPPDNGAGIAGINRVGDSRLIGPGQTRTVRITAAAGKTLYFICEFHPWMQGKLIVR
jgi:plastocyanin